MCLFIVLYCYAAMFTSASSLEDEDKPEMRPGAIGISSSSPIACRSSSSSDSDHTGNGVSGSVAVSRDGPDCWELAAPGSWGLAVPGCRRLAAPG